MKNFGKHLLQGILWLTASEVLCLILAVSLAILPDHPAVRMIALCFGISAHMLLMGSCAQRAAAEDLILYRSEAYRIRILKPILVAVILTLPSYVTYILLTVNAESILIINLFPLLNAPFIRIYKYLIGGTEPFRAVPVNRRAAMAFPPLLTALAYFGGYVLRYYPSRAALDARSHRT